MDSRQITALVRSDRAKPTPRDAFTLAECVVALALAGLVLVPSGVALHRLLAADDALRRTLEVELQGRRALEESAFLLEQGVVPPDTLVQYPPGSSVRLVCTYRPADPSSPPELRVRASSQGTVAREFVLQVPVVAPDGMSSDAP